MQICDADKESFKIWLGSLDGKEVEIIVRELRNLRTLAMNRYYWAVVVETIAESLGYDRDKMHDILKTRYNSELVNFKGKEVWITKSTAGLTIEEFIKYVDRCKQFAAEEGILIPDVEKVEINL